MTGFLEESAGVRSMTRLVMLGLMMLAAVLVGVIAFYVVYQIRHEKPLDALAIGAIVGGITALVLNGIVAIQHRNREES